MQGLRLSIKDLFGIVAFCSIVAWCASRVGFDNAMFWIVLCISAVLSALFVTFVYLAQDEKRRHFSPLAAVAFLACCLLALPSMPLVMNALLLLVAGIVCACRPPLRVRTLWAVAMISASLALIAGVLPGIFEVRELLAMRQEYPVVSLESRLKYEQRHRPSANAPDLVVSAAVLAELEDFEDDLDADDYRGNQLERIHKHQYELFVRAIGFGVARMLRPRPESLRRPPLEDIPFDGKFLAELGTGRKDWRGAWRAGQSNDVEHLHTVSRNDFLDADSFGASVEPIVRVVGFVEHGFHYSPARGFEDREMWKIVRLELVSLLKFDEPRVYVLDRLPRMDQLSSDDVPTRPLDGFESDALEQLRTEEDLVISRQGSEYRMLGSLRAARQCVDCHDVERGELLGAFSYLLFRGSTTDDP